MHSIDKQDFQLGSFIKTANEITCSLRENRARFKESLRNLEDEFNLREERNGEKNVKIEDVPVHTANSNLSSYVFCSDLIPGDINEDMKTTKISINCPKCSEKLGVRVNSTSQSELLKSGDQGIKLLILPSDRGDSLECDNHTHIMLNSIAHFKATATGNHNMSYTILKGCNSSPESSVNAENRNSLIKPRGSRSQIIDRKSIGKSTISLDATAAPNPLFLCKHSSCQKLAKQQTNVSGSHSFTVASASLNEPAAHDVCASVHGIYTNRIQTPEESEAGSSFRNLPHLQELTQPEAHLETFINRRLFDENTSLIGIDKVDTPELYDSSSATSCECDDESKVHQGAGLNNAVSQFSHPAPVQPEASLVEDSLKMKNDEMQRHEAESQTLSPLSQEEYDILGYEIPAYRQDLYKDCFTLFLEKWFGKHDS